MSFLYLTAITILTFLTMEAIAWITHRYVMHGFLWYLHEDHHKPQGTRFEKNDFFFAIFAIPSILFIILGLYFKNSLLSTIGFGIALYGVAYFIVHEVIIHQRFKWLSKSNNRYIRTIRKAHKMHHKHLEKENGESFGMLIVAKKYWDMTRKDQIRSKKS